MSKFQVGDKAVYVGDGRILVGDFAGQNAPFGYGDVVSILDGPDTSIIDGSVAWTVHNYGGGHYLRIRESLLRKIDDGDEIPSSIRAIFSDKTDETLPVSAKEREQK